ncbi:MAG: rod shape-determining protein MreC [Holosporales bacterium]|nr:rod shape-determining protein MreC [Holosporales bacterium]
MLSTFSSVSRRSQAKVRLFFSKVRLIIFLLAALVIFSFNLNNERFSSIRAIIFDHTSIMTKFITSPIRSIAEVKTWIDSYLKIHHKNKKLEIKLKQMEEWALKAHALALENQQLRQLLKISPDPQMSYITAPVLGIVQAPYTKTIVLGAGSKKGIKLRQPVVMGQHIVGRIVEVSEQASRVLLIQDVNSHIPVILEKSKVQGIASGNDESHLIIKFFEMEAKAEIGELIFTSGVGGIYPKGYLVGRVAYQNGEIVRVKSLIRLNELEYVHVFVDMELPEENIKPSRDIKGVS